MKRCPHCGGKTFAVDAHIIEGWKVNEYGMYIETYEPCKMVVHHPDDYDIWYCWECGYEAPGSEFNVKEDY